MRTTGKSMPNKDIYGGVDPREAPIYPVKEASRYLAIPYTTLRDWTRGQASRSPYEPVIKMADPDLNLLSFWNVCEAHVCEALRNAHRIPMQGIRRAALAIRARFPEGDHPLIQHKLLTSGSEMFLEVLEGEGLMNLSMPGQSVIKECLELYSKRVEFDQDDVASKLFPFTRTAADKDAPKIVVLDPSVMFGRPVIDGTRIAASVVYERFSAGESTSELATDYGRPAKEIEEAIRCWQYKRAA